MGSTESLLNSSMLGSVLLCLWKVSTGWAVKYPRSSVSKLETVSLSSVLVVLEAAFLSVPLSDWVPHSVSSFESMKLGSRTSVFDTCPPGSSLSIRSITRIGFAVPIREAALLDEALSVHDRTRFGVFAIYSV